MPQIAYYYSHPQPASSAVLSATSPQQRHLAASKAYAKKHRLDLRVLTAQPGAGVRPSEKRDSNLSIDFMARIGRKEIAPGDTLIIDSEWKLSSASVSKLLNGLQRLFLANVRIVLLPSETILTRPLSLVDMVIPLVEDALDDQKQRQSLRAKAAWARRKRNTASSH